MADSKGFSHITVTPDDDEDVVIQAGVVTADDAPYDDEVVEEEVIEEEPEAEPEAEEPESGPAGDFDSEAATEPARPATVPPADDGYHETTLDDLASTKMSTTQKAVIVVALLAIIAFVVWYVLAR